MIKSFMMHGGDVVAFSGDAMTVVFPGDDLTLCARQCARCALHILEATKGYSLAGEGLENELTLHAPTPLSWNVSTTITPAEVPRGTA